MNYKKEKALRNNCNRFIFFGGGNYDKGGNEILAQ